MSTRESLSRRPDVDPKDVDDIIGIAEELQQAEREQAQRASVEELEAVASELDIDPRYVEAAIAELQGRREQEQAAAEAAAAQAEAERRARLAFWARWRRTIAMVAAGAMVLTGAVSLMGRGAMLGAQQDVRGAEAALQVVVERQARLVPRLVALQGGDGQRLIDAAEAVTTAGSVADQLKASVQLDRALTAELAALPQTTSEAAAQQRLSLQHELEGAQNRITVEQRRYEEALATWRSTADRFAPSLAIALGIVDGPK